MSTTYLVLATAEPYLQYTMPTIYTNLTFTSYTLDWARTRAHNVNG